MQCSTLWCLLLLLLLLCSWCFIPLISLTLERCVQGLGKLGCPVVPWCMHVPNGYRWLDLGSNTLSGTIPDSVSALTSLG